MLMLALEACFQTYFGQPPNPYALICVIEQGARVELLGPDGKPVYCEKTTRVQKESTPNGEAVTYFFAAGQSLRFSTGKVQFNGKMELDSVQLSPEEAEAPLQKLKDSGICLR